MRDRVDVDGSRGKRARRLEGTVAALRAFAVREPVLCVAGVAALASCAAVPPDAGYAGYVDWRTLALLFCLMAVVVGFRELGVLDAAGSWLIARARTQRALAAALVGLTFFASMIVTNDVALITFVPLALSVLRQAGLESRLCLVAALMTIAANLGSMLTPIGNPQNLFLIGASGMSVGAFMQLMMPYTAASGILLALVALVAFPGRPVACASGCQRGRHSDNAAATPGRCSGKSPQPVQPALGSCASKSRRSGALPGQGAASRTLRSSSARLRAAAPTPASRVSERRRAEAAPDQGAVPRAPRDPSARLRAPAFTLLIAGCLASVAGLLDVRVLLAAVVFAIGVLDAKLFRRIDWGLLATFVALFVFVGNMGRLPALNAALAEAVRGNALLAGVAASQVISNVPAAVLLSGFTDRWADLIVGVNLGGLGTLIASMASVITFRAVSIGRPRIRGRYLAVFTVCNIAFLAVLLVLSAAL